MGDGCGCFFVKDELSTKPQKMYPLVLLMVLLALVMISGVVEGEEMVPVCALAGEAAGEDRFHPFWCPSLSILFLFAIKGPPVDHVSVRSSPFLQLQRPLSSHFESGKLLGRRGRKPVVSSSETALSSTSQSALDPSEEAAIQDVISEVPPKTPPSKNGAPSLVVPTLSSSTNSAMPIGSASAVAASILVRPLLGGPTATTILSRPITVRGIAESSAAATSSSSILNPSGSVKDDDNVNFPSRRSSPAILEIGFGIGISRGIPNQSTISAPMSLGSVSGISSNGSLGSVSTVSDISKRNLLNVDERIGGGLVQPLVSPVSNRMLQKVAKNNDGTGSNDSNSVSEIVGGRVFSPSAVFGIQWRP